MLPTGSRRCSIVTVRQVSSSNWRPGASNSEHPRALDGRQAVSCPSHAIRIAAQRLSSALRPARSLMVTVTMTIMKPARIPCPDFAHVRPSMPKNLPYVAANIHYIVKEAFRGVYPYAS